VNATPPLRPGKWRKAGRSVENLSNLNAELFAKTPKNVALPYWMTLHGHSTAPLGAKPSSTLRAQVTNHIQVKRMIDDP